VWLNSCENFNREKTLQMKAQTSIFIALILLLAFQFVQAQDFASLVQTGETARQRGEYARAFENFNQALNAAETAGDQSKQAQIYNLRGHIHYLQAEYNAAIRSFRQAEKLANSVNDKREEARAWAFLGQLYWRVTKKEDGERLLKDALRSFEKSNDEINIALTLRFLGRLENGKSVFPKIISQGVYSNAKPSLDYYERSLAISRKISDEEGELTTLKEIGLVYQNQDKTPQRLERAMSYFEPLRERLKNSNYRRLYAVVLNNIATNEYFWGRADSNGSGVDDKSKMEKSIATADEAARIFREIGDRQELREMLDRKAFCLHYLGRYAEALLFIDESIKIAAELYYQPIGDALDRSLYFESLIGAYRQKMNALYQLNRPAEMFETYEAMKSLALRDLMNRGRERKTRALSGEEIAEEKRLNNELNSLNRQILQIKQTDKSANLQIADLNRQLQEARLAKEEWQANIAAEDEKINPPVRAQNLNIAQMCASIPDKNTAIIEYHANNIQFGETFILMKTDTDFEPFAMVKNLATKNLLSEKIALPGGNACSINVYYSKGYLENEKYTAWHLELRSRLPEFREQLARNSPAFKQNAKFLYDAFLADAMPLLKDKTHLVIIPSGVICDVPFQALMNENGRYLIEDYAVSYAPSLTVLAEMQMSRRKLIGYKHDGDFLAFGNPKLSAETVAKLRSRYRSGKLENLPEAETEVKTIGAFYPKSKIVIGKNATENLWQTESPKYRILHLATHGLSDAEKPLYSHVLLSADADHDGLIEGREIADLKLKAEMVVLSACETARGREIDGEGMVGLAWSFAAAGVPTIIASGWKVDSENTADLMVDFYTKINQNQQMFKAEAMRRAALGKLAATETRHPFYWAGFAVFGDWQN
jgi:CHAT domain-containing protein